MLADFYPRLHTTALERHCVRARRSATAGSAAPRLRDEGRHQLARLAVDGTGLPGCDCATQLRFVAVQGEHKLQRYLGAWGHMLIASSDAIDMMHEHPFLADGGPNVEFEAVFPRPAVYRVWVQFQSDGVVDTAHFDIPVGQP